MAHDQSMHIAMRVQAGRTRKAVAQAHIAQSMGPTWCLLRRLSTAPNVARTNAVSVTVAVLQDEISYFIANHKLTHSLTPVHKRIYAAAAPAAAAAAVVVVLTILMARRLIKTPAKTDIFLASDHRVLPVSASCVGWTGRCSHTFSCPCKYKTTCKRGSERLIDWLLCATHSSCSAALSQIEHKDSTIGMTHTVWFY